MLRRYCSRRSRLPTRQGLRSEGRRHSDWASVLLPKHGLPKLGSPGLPHARRGQVVRVLLPTAFGGGWDRGLREYRKDVVATEYLMLLGAIFRKQVTCIDRMSFDCKNVFQVPFSHNVLFYILYTAFVS